MDPEETGVEKTAEAKISWPMISLIVAVAFVALALDQVSKFLIEAEMELNTSVEVIPGLLDFTYVLNPGAAFSFASGATWLFTSITVIVIGVIIWFAPRIHSKPWAIMLAMLLGGTLGNLVDRIFREPGILVGHVVDFIHISFFPAIFNVADIFIVTSMCLFLLLSLLGLNIDGTKHVKEKSIQQD